MRNFLLLFSLGALSIAGCGESIYSNTPSGRSASFGEVEVAWRDLSSMGPFLADRIQLPEGEGAYMFVGVDSRQEGGDTGLSLRELIALSERAVAAEGSCMWLGYDPVFDQRVRATGQLASSSDERLFFAKLKCG